MDTIDQLLQERIIAVIRSDDRKKAFDIIEATIKGGIKAIEVTFTIPEAETLMASLKKDFGESILLGAGTVLNLDMCKKAIDNGAQYIVSPGFVEACAKHCHDHNIPYIPGCMTVSEMMTALRHHAPLIKLFPGNHFTPGYIKSIKAPLPDLKIMVTGGVDIGSLDDWFAHGADMVGIGSALTKTFEAGDLNAVRETARAYKTKIKEVVR